MQDEVRGCAMLENLQENIAHEELMVFLVEAIALVKQEEAIIGFQP